MAQYLVGRGVWSTPVANPEDGNIPPGTLLQSSKMARRLADDLTFDYANGVPETDPDNTIYVVYFAPSIVPSTLAMAALDGNGKPLVDPVTGDETPGEAQPGVNHLETHEIDEQTTDVQGGYHFANGDEVDDQCRNRSYLDGVVISQV